MRRGLRLVVALAIVAVSAAFLLASAGDAAACAAPPDGSGTPGSTWCAPPH
jgi:hypothetical protein